MNDERPGEVAVELDARELGGLLRIGTLRRIGSSGIVAFAYDDDWLADRRAFVIDPAHGLYGGDQYPRSGADIAGIVSDAAPDRWGRTLLERAEGVRARAQGRRRRTLGEWEFLLGVSDATRMGALRFVTDEGRYLNDATDAIPPLTRLRELEQAARALERPGREPRADEAEQLALLLAPGSSLGGARPKASFEGQDGELWMAKFPSRNDRHDVGACELVLNTLAQRAGISVPEHRILRLGAEHHTFAARRFDRAPGTRRHYASAMTMTARRDRDEASYLDIALAIADHGAPDRIEEDLGQLFRRVAFNVLTSHRDDHLRNHGFLRTMEGWRLAPAFDLNPVPRMPAHELSIDGTVHAGDLAAVRASAPFYRLAKPDSDAIIDEVVAALGAWRTAVLDVDLGWQEIDLLDEAILV